MLSTTGNVQEQSLLVRQKSPCTSPLNRALRMHPNPNKDGGRKHTPAPYVHPSLQLQTTPTPVHQVDGSNSVPFFPHPALTSANYFTNTSHGYAPVTGSYPHHPSFRMGSPHNSTYDQHPGSLRPLHSAHRVSSSSQWLDAGSTIQTQYQMDGTSGRYEEDAALWHSFLNGSTPRPPFRSEGQSEMLTSAAGEPIQYVILVVTTQTLSEGITSRRRSLSPLHVPPDSLRTSQPAVKRKRVTHETASVEEDSQESDDGAPNPTVKR